MTKEELININGIREDLYQAMQIGDITLSSKNSQKLVDFMNYQDKEIERLNNKYNKALEKINDYKIYCENNKGLTEYTDIEIEAIEPVISKLEDILKEEK